MTYTKKQIIIEAEVPEGAIEYMIERASFSCEIVVTFWKTIGTRAYYWDTSIDEWSESSNFYISQIGKNRIKPIEVIE